ncbi:MAG: hypothetical protein AB7V53_10450 [Dongiaceae bacterium]
MGGYRNDALSDAVRRTSCDERRGAGFFVAAILNWDAEPAVKMLAILAPVGVYLLLIGLDAIHDRLVQIEHWGRLVFLAAHIRNEHDGLPRAAERLREDQAIDKENAEEARQIAAMSVLSPDAAGVTMWLVFAAILGGLLHFGAFGEIGKGWLDDVLRAAGIQ